MRAEMLAAVPASPSVSKPGKRPHGAGSPADPDRLAGTPADPVQRARRQSSADLGPESEALGVHYADQPLNARSVDDPGPEMLG
jgi:hypothetical protein